MSAQNNIIHRPVWTRERTTTTMRQTQHMIKKQYKKLKEQAWVVKLDHKFKKHFGKASEPVPSEEHVQSDVLKDDKNRVDGWFGCTNCHAEVSLFYEQGKYPFGVMRCPLCKPWAWGSTIQKDSAVSPLLKRIHDRRRDVIPVPPYPAILNNQVPYFTVCTRCGLTHRARKVNPASLTEEARQEHGLCDVDLSESALVSFEHIVRCPECSLLLEDGNPKTQWQRFSIHYATGFHLPNETYDGFFGVIIPRDD
jgi:hypothetical protein